LPEINTHQHGDLGATRATSLNEKADGGPVYGAGAKSAGSINDKSSSSRGGRGQTNLTGKNPFAILKASAIASVQSATFPNNFQNLPKVSPPFLDPPKPEDSKFCLVLDLDETLIHNVEVSPRCQNNLVCSTAMKAISL